MCDSFTKPLILFATPPSLDQLCAITIYLSNSTQNVARFQPQVIKCREFIFTEPEIIGTPGLDINDHCFHLIAKGSLMNSGKLQARLARIGLEGTKPYPVTTELYQSCLRYTLLARLSPTWNKAGPWLIQGRDFLTHQGCANAVKMDLSVNEKELYFTLEAAVLKSAPLHEQGWLSSGKKGISSPPWEETWGKREERFREETPFFPEEMEETRKKLGIKITDLDILGKCLEKFVSNTASQIDHYSIASDWCYILPSMKRGRIVRISHEIPEDSPFRSYRDLKRHWKNTYGYRLPESEDEMNYYQIHFGPLGGKLFTYPEVCLRGRDLQKVARVDPKPILRAFMQEIQNKFPTVCGCPIKLQSKAKFPITDLFSSVQATSQNQPNLTSRMGASRPAVYRTKAEMEKMLSSTPDVLVPVLSCKPGSSSSNAQVRLLPPQPGSTLHNATPCTPIQTVARNASTASQHISGILTSQSTITDKAKHQMQNTQNHCPADLHNAVMHRGGHSTALTVQQIIKQSLNHVASHQVTLTGQAEITPKPVPMQVISRHAKHANNEESMTNMDDNGDIKSRSENADKPKQPGQMKSQAAFTRKLFPQFHPKKAVSMPQTDICNLPSAPKIVPLFHQQTKAKSVALVKSSTGTGVNKLCIPHSSQRIITPGQGLVPSFQRSVTALSRQTISPAADRAVPSFQKSGMQCISATSQKKQNNSKTEKKDKKEQSDKKATKRANKVKTDSRGESRKSKKMKKAEA